MNTPALNNHFLLVGNGVYTNRGCEAIVRGTMDILRGAFGHQASADLACFGDPVMCEKQAGEESDPGIRRTYSLSVPTSRWERWARGINHRALLHLPWPEAFRIPGSYRVITESLRNTSAALQVGGDNYSLDYGFPVAFMELDRCIQDAGVPLVIWGASIGPFHARPTFARKMFKHLKSVSAIFVRETLTQEYLFRNGVRENVHFMPDPAFLMRAEAPPPRKMLQRPPLRSIGINLSPLYGKYVCKDRADEWLSVCVDLVVSVQNRTARPIVLVPHVVDPRPPNDDHYFLERVAEEARRNGAGELIVVGRDLSAAETKWLISNCAVFGGARMHSVIAALSTCTPTLAFAYSTKAKGLVQDVLGTRDYVIDASAFQPQAVTERLATLLSREKEVRLTLENRMPAILRLARRAGEELRSILSAGA